MSVHISSTQREILMIIFQLIQLRVHILIAYSSRSIYGRKGISCKKKIIILSTEVTHAFVIYHSKRMSC